MISLRVSPAKEFISSLLITWHGVPSDLKQFSLYRGLSPTGPWTLVTHIVDPNIKSYIDVGLRKEYSYYYVLFKGDSMVSNIGGANQTVNTKANTPFTLDNGNDPVLGWPFPPVDYQLFAHNDDPHRLTWTNPDVNPGYMWFGPFNNETPAIYFVWTSNTNDPTTAKVNGPGFNPASTYYWITDGHDIAPTGVGSSPIGGINFLGKVTIGSALGGDQFAVVFTSWVDTGFNSITGFSLYTSTDGITYTHVIDLAANISFYDDPTNIPNPTIWYRLVGHSTQFDFPYNDVSAGQPAGYLWWAKGGLTMNGNGTINAVACDSSGNTYACGGWNATINFGDGDLNSNFASNVKDIIIVKYDPVGNIVWKKQIGGHGNDKIFGAIVDSNNDLVVIGFFGQVLLGGDGSVDFGNGTPISPNSPNSGDMFIAKYSSAGALKWVVHFTNIFPVGDVTNGGASLVADTSNNLFVCATCGFNANFGGFPMTPAGGAIDQDLAIAKVNGTNGTVIWALNYGASLNELPKGIALDKFGNIIVVGQVQGNTTNLGGGTLTNSGAGSVAFVAKYSGVNGAHIYSKLYGLSNSNQATAVACDPLTGNIVITGGFSDSINFGGGNIGGSGGVFVVGLDVSGNQLWTMFTGATASDFGNCVKIQNGKMVVAGKASNNLYFGLGGTSSFGNGQANGWVAIFTISGIVKPVNTFLRYYGATTDGANSVGCIAFDPVGKLVVGGAQLNTIDYGVPPPTGSPSTPITAGMAGYTSVFTAKYQT